MLAPDGVVHKTHPIIRRSNPHSTYSIMSSNLHAVKYLSTNQSIHPEDKQSSVHLSNYFTNYPPIHLILYPFAHPQSHQTFQATRSYAPTNQTQAPKPYTPILLYTQLHTD